MQKIENDKFKILNNFLTDSLVNDKIVYSNVFNLLSSDDSIKNYSYNETGIFFNYDDLDESNINNTVQFINNFYRKKEEIDLYEKNRKEIVIQNNTNKKTKDIMQQLSDDIQYSLNNDNSTKIHSSDSEDEKNSLNEYEEYTQQSDYDQMKDLFGEESD